MLWQCIALGHLGSFATIIYIGCFLSLQYNNHLDENVYCVWLLGHCVGRVSALRIMLHGRGAWIRCQRVSSSSNLLYRNYIAIRLSHMCSRDTWGKFSWRHNQHILYSHSTILFFNSVSLNFIFQYSFILLSITDLFVLLEPEYNLE